MTLITCNKETFTVCFQSCGNKDIVSVKSIRNLFCLKVFKDVELSFICSCHHSIIIKPCVVSVMRLLTHFIELLHRLKSIFLDSPQLPMLRAWCTNLMIVFWVESNLINPLLGKVNLTENPTFMEPFICYCFSIYTLLVNKRKEFAVLRKRHAYNRLILLSIGKHAHGLVVWSVHLSTSLINSRHRIIC